MPRRMTKIEHEEWPEQDDPVRGLVVDRLCVKDTTNEKGSECSRQSKSTLSLVIFLAYEDGLTSSFWIEEALRGLYHAPRW